MDTDRDTTGTDGKGCNAYKPGDCGTQDSNDFKSNEMCCACGGGIGMLKKLYFWGHISYIKETLVIQNLLSDQNIFTANCWNIEGGYTDSIGRSCNDYGKSSVKCGFFDTTSFYSEQMCCICGGGRFGN